MSAGIDVGDIVRKYEDGRVQAHAVLRGAGLAVTIPLDQLGPGPKVRREHVDLDHVTALVEGAGSWPPIKVCKADWGRPYRVLDGNHRVAAAGRLGRAGILATVVEVDVKSAEAIELATKANIEHGRPLTLAERKSQAQWFVNNTDWTDRRIGEACGLTNKSVATMRPKPARAGEENDPPARRTGRDGKSYPTPAEAVERREAAAREIKARPTASDREVAKRAGLSPRTVADVRRRNEAGEDPAPRRLRAVPDPKPEPETPAEAPQVKVSEVAPSIPSDWMRHPAANRTNATRSFFRFMNRWVRVKAFQDDRQECARMCPPDARDEAIRAARWMAKQMAALADELEKQPTVEVTE